MNAATRVTAQITDILADFDDPVCQAGWPYWETSSACGLGGELLLLYAALRAAVRRR